MYRDHRKYIDFDGNEREEDFWFHLKKSDLVEMNLSITGGLEKMIKQIIAAQDMPEIMKLFKKLITMSYGIKSADGKRFMRSEEATQAYLETEAYSDFFMELIQDSDKAGAFVAQIIPQDLQEEAKRLMAENPQLKVVNGQSNPNA